MDDDPNSALTNCPNCGRTIWRGAVCHHGRNRKPPPPVEPEPEQPAYRPDNRRGRDRGDAGV